MSYSPVTGLLILKIPTITRLYGIKTKYFYVIFTLKCYWTFWSNYSSYCCYYTNFERVVLGINKGLLCIKFHIIFRGGFNFFFLKLTFSLDFSCSTIPVFNAFNNKVIFSSNYLETEIVTLLKKKMNIFRGKEKWSTNIWKKYIYRHY